MPQQYKLMIARFPGMNVEHPRSAGYLMKLWAELQHEDRISEIVPFCVSDTPITMVRNRCVRTALEHEVDYLLMLDADMHPDYLLGDDDEAKPFWETSWEFMMRRRDRESRLFDDVENGPCVYGRPPGDVSSEKYPPATIAAPYCGPPPIENVYIFDWQSDASDDPSIKFRLRQIGREDAARRAGIHQVAALPTGLILYDMRVFKNLPTPWFAYEYEDAEETAKCTTEDVYQTRNAALLDMPQFCNFDSWAGHIKLKTVGKPSVVHCDLVSDSLREAIEKRRFSADRLVQRGVG